MLSREGCITTIKEQIQRNQQYRALHPLWEEYLLPDSMCVYFNPYSGQLSMEFPKSSRECKGGILADEMGLGKTVMLLALVHSHIINDGVAENRSYLEEEGQIQLKMEPEQKTPERKKKIAKKKVISKQLHRYPTRNKGLETPSTAEDLDAALDSSARVGSKLVNRKLLNKSDVVRKLNVDGEQVESEESAKSDSKLVEEESDINEDDQVEESDSSSSSSYHASFSELEESMNQSLNLDNTHEKSPPSLHLRETLKKPKNKLFSSNGKLRRKQAGTLIVVPVTLLSQWEMELKTHSHRHSLKHLVYYGGNRQMVDLSFFDIVFTTYGTISQEFVNTTNRLLFKYEW